MALAPEIEKINTETPAEQGLDKSIIDHDAETQEGLHKLEGYLEQVTQTPTQVVTDDATNQPILTPSQAQQVTITLPLTEEEVEHGLHHKVVDAVFWIAAFCKRMAQKAIVLGFSVAYKERNQEPKL